MNDEHKPESTYGDEWFALEDGLTGSRRNVLGATYVPLRASVPSVAPARKQAARPAALARLPDQAELLLEARRLFDAMGVHLPQRINAEELGDALEVLQRMVRAGHPKWRIQMRILSILFWVSAHTAQDGVHSLIGTETASTGNYGQGHE